MFSSEIYIYICVFWLEKGGPFTKELPQVMDNTGAILMICGKTEV